jgi:hypothetical protein
VPSTGDSGHQATSSVSLHRALFNQDKLLAAMPPPAGQLHAATPSEPCDPFHAANSKRPYHLTQLQLGGPEVGKEEQFLGGHAQLKRPLKRQQVHVTAEAAASWDTSKEERGQYAQHSATAFSNPPKFTYEQHQQQLYSYSPPSSLLGAAWGLSKVPPGALLSGPRPYRGQPLSAPRASDADFGMMPSSRDMSPQLRLLAKQLTKMDVACAHDQVGIVLPREDVLGSGILGMMGQQQQQQQLLQGEQEGSECPPLELRIADLGSADKRAASARDWMSCQLTQSSNRKFWYLTGLGSFLKRHSARDGQVLELSCGVHHGTFSATLR